MFNLYDCCITWNAFYEANLFTSFNRNKYSQEFQFHCAFSSHYFYLNWLWTCPEQCKHMPPAQMLLCCLPTDGFGICFCYILIRYKSAEGHWCPWKAWAPSTFSQPLSLLLWFPGCCINTQVTGRLENVISVATPVDGKRKSISMDCVFRHAHKPATANELHWFSVAVFRGLVCDFIHC